MRPPCSIVIIIYSLNFIRLDLFEIVSRTIGLSDNLSMFVTSLWNLFRLDYLYLPLTHLVNVSEFASGFLTSKINRLM